MALFLGQLADSIYESQRGLEIGKLVLAHDVMLVDDLPLRGIGQLPMKFGEFFPLSGGTPPRQGMQFRSASIELPTRQLLERNIFVRNRRTAGRSVLRLGRALVEVVAT